MLLYQHFFLQSLVLGRHHLQVALEIAKLFVDRFELFQLLLQLAFLLRKAQLSGAVPTPAAVLARLCSTWTLWRPGDRSTSLSRPAGASLPNAWFCRCNISEAPRDPTKTAHHTADSGATKTQRDDSASVANSAADENSNATTKKHSTHRSALSYSILSNLALCSTQAISDELEQQRKRHTSSKTAKPKTKKTKNDKKNTFLNQRNARVEDVCTETAQPNTHTHTEVSVVFFLCDVVAAR